MVESRQPHRRLTFVNGVIEGIFLKGNYTCARTEILKLIHRKANVDTVNDLNAFYADKQNEVIPIQSAWIYLAAKAHDATPEQLEELVKQHRAILKDQK